MLPDNQRRDFLIRHRTARKNPQSQQHVTDEFRAQALAGLCAEAELLQSRANDLNRDASSEAAFQVARRVVLLFDAPWAGSEPHAAARYFAARDPHGPRDAEAVREFEVDARALYALAHGRLPDTFDELATFMDPFFRPPV